MGHDKYFPGVPRDMSYYTCFTRTIFAFGSWSRNYGQEVKFSFDMRKQSDSNAGALYGVWVNMPEWEKTLLPGVSFIPSPNSPRIQMADLFTFETMKVLDNELSAKKRPVRKSMARLTDTG